MRPAGLIYGAFTDAMLVDPFAIPLRWTRAVGVDFGGANNAIIYAAQKPETGVWYIYAEWLGGGLSSAEYADKAREGLLGAPNWQARALWAAHLIASFFICLRAILS